MEGGLCRRNAAARGLCNTERPGAHQRDSYRSGVLVLFAAVPPAPSRNVDSHVTRLFSLARRAQDSGENHEWIL